ncbi:MAG TPA: response regulator transcription factor [Rhizomicrobium sp.]|nr:response regulator transcription factor [Rhizomicrobium sp.]
MTTAPIRIMIADDHPLLREGVAAVLANHGDMKVVAEAGNGSEAVELFRKHGPDVTLMDLQMPVLSGVDAIREIRSQAPQARIIVLTTYSGDTQAARALRAGASGYLLKSMLRDDLVETIRLVHAGRRRVPPEIAAEIAEHLADEGLSDREIEVLVRVARGSANKEIARHLSVSVSTVNTHVKNIMQKLRAKDRTQAVTIALKRGIMEI